MSIVDPKKPVKLTQTFVDALDYEKEGQKTYRDGEVNGFVLKVGSKTKTYARMYRNGKGREASRRWLKLGLSTEISAKDAREKAKKMAAAVVGGSDPAVEEREERQALTTAEALSEFLKQYVSKLAPLTFRQYETLVRLYAAPGLGKKKLETITKQDIQALHHAVGKRQERPVPLMANRLVKMLSKFFGWCAEVGFVPDKFNPAYKLKLYPEKGKTGYFQSTELMAIQNAMAVLEKRRELDWRAAGIFRLLMLTAARRSEIQTLRWEYLDLENGRANLPESKTGEKVLYLPAPAVAVLRQLRARLDQEPILKNSCWVFPSDKVDAKKGYLVEIRRPWRAVLAEAGLPAGVDGDWTLHHLRHTWASLAVNQNVSIALVFSGARARPNKHNATIYPCSGQSRRRCGRASNSRYYG